MKRYSVEWAEHREAVWKQIGRMANLHGLNPLFQEPERWLILACIEENSELGEHYFECACLREQYDNL